MWRRRSKLVKWDQIDQAPRIPSDTLVTGKILCNVWSALKWVLMIKLVVFFQRWNFNIVTPSNLCVCVIAAAIHNKLHSALLATLALSIDGCSFHWNCMFYYGTQLNGISFVRRTYKCSVVIVGQIKEKNLVSFRMIMGFRDWSWFSSMIF